MRVPLLGIRLCKIYQSFEMTYVAESRQSLVFFIESKFCKSEFYFLKRHKKVMAIYIVIKHACFCSLPAELLYIYCQRRIQQW